MEYGEKDQVAGGAQAQSLEPIFTLFKSVLILSSLSFLLWLDFLTKWYAQKRDEHNEGLHEGVKGATKGKATSMFHSYHSSLSLQSHRLGTSLSRLVIFVVRTPLRIVPRNTWQRMDDTYCSKKTAQRLKVRAYLHEPHVIL